MPILLYCAILLTLSDLFLLTQYHVLKHRSAVFNLGNSASSICVWEEKYKILQNIQFSHNVRDITVTNINVKMFNWQTPQKYKITFAFHIQSSSIILPSDFIEFFTLIMVAATLLVSE